MHYEVTEHEDSVELRVIGTGDRAPALLASMQECQEGRCTCPTDQFNRLETIEVLSGDDNVTVSLRPSPGERLDVNELAACLDYTIAKAGTD